MKDLLWGHLFQGLEAASLAPTFHLHIAHSTRLLLSLASNCEESFLLRLLVGFYVFLDL